METKNSFSFVLGICQSLGYNKIHAVESVGKNGGLAIFWKDNLDVEVFFKDK